jgi:hypothetical protein
MCACITRHTITQVVLLVDLLSDLKVTQQFPQLEKIPVGRSSSAASRLENRDMLTDRSSPFLDRGASTPTAHNTLPRTVVVVAPPPPPTTSITPGRERPTWEKLIRSRAVKAWHVTQACLASRSARLRGVAPASEAAAGRAFSRIPAGVVVCTCTRQRYDRVVYRQSLRDGTTASQPLRVAPRQASSRPAPPHCRIGGSRS